MIGWIMECVTTTSFLISINGSLHGFFKGKRGLRQGDPLSPYLFTLVMEILTLMLQRGVSNANLFSYHRYCSKLKLINLCFADDLFLFSHGDTDSVKVIKEALNEFKEASGLVPSLPKSKGYFCNVLNFTKIAILQILPFEEAGRLQLIRSVLSSMHIYWASMFILPSRVLLDIEQIIRRFLWSHGSMKKGRAKVAWDVVCLKDEGGLGVRRLDTFNKALMVSHMWNFLSSKESLWVKWVHVYKLKGRNFWELPIRGRLSWGWRKVLQLRPLIRDYIGFSISDGDKASLWFDNWSTLGPLADFISSHDRHVAGLNASSKVWDYMKSFAALPYSNEVFQQILLEVIPFSKRKSPKSVVAKLVLAASAYFIWQERNWRLYKKNKRTVQQVRECIYSTVRLKLLSCRFKKSKSGASLAQRWNLPHSCFV
ncbi:putative reverse transcriptase domain, reverse transcriptase zinc-binding domain protein [Tanacetum coccineum]